MSYQKSSWSWQLQQFQRQVGEWVELQFSRFDSALPKSSLDLSWLNAYLKLAVWLLLAGVATIRALSISLKKFSLLSPSAFSAV